MEFEPMSYTVPVERRSKKCRFRNLTQLEIKVICNGCGSKGGWFKPPDYRFRASCDHHDFNWWLGGNDLDRELADDKFLREMLHDATFDRCGRRRPAWRRWWYKGAAYRYYYAVRIRQSAPVVKLIGKGTFNYHPPENTDEQWTRLEKYMEDRGFDVEADYDKEDWE